MRQFVGWRNKSLRTRSIRTFGNDLSRSLHWRVVMLNTCNYSAAQNWHTV